MGPFCFGDSSSFPSSPHTLSVCSQDEETPGCGIQGENGGCCNEQEPSLLPELSLTGPLGVFTVSPARWCSSARRRPVNLLTSLP